MSQTLQNQLLLSKSMNGIISFDDGAGTTISNGQVTTNGVNTDAITTNTLTVPSLSLTDLTVTGTANVPTVTPLGDYSNKVVNTQYLADTLYAFQVQEAYFQFPLPAPIGFIAPNVIHNYLTPSTTSIKMPNETLLPYEGFRYIIYTQRQWSSLPSSVPITTITGSTFVFNGQIVSSITMDVNNSFLEIICINIGGSGVCWSVIRKDPNSLLSSANTWTNVNQYNNPLCNIRSSWATGGGYNELYRNIGQLLTPLGYDPSTQIFDIRAEAFPWSIDSKGTFFRVDPNVDLLQCSLTNNNFYYNVQIGRDLSVTTGTTTLKNTICFSGGMDVPSPLSLVTTTSIGPNTLSVCQPTAYADNITAIGSGVLQVAANTHTGTTAIGAQAFGQATNLGNNNTAIGYRAGYNITSTNVTNCTFIGNNTGVANPTSVTGYANSLVIGNGAIITNSNTVNLGGLGLLVVVPSNLQIQSKFVERGSGTLYSAAFSMTAVPFTYYSINSVTAFSITLLAPVGTYLGTRVTFRRVSGDPNNAITSASANIHRFDSNTPTNELLPAGVYSCTICCMLISGINYGWFQIETNETPSGAYVDLTTNQNVFGIKTFEDGIVVSPTKNLSLQGSLLSATQTYNTNNSVLSLTGAKMVYVTANTVTQLYLPLPTAADVGKVFTISKSGGATWSLALRRNVGTTFTIDFGGLATNEVYSMELSEFTVDLMVMSSATSGVCYNVLYTTPTVFRNPIVYSSAFFLPPQSNIPPTRSNINTIVIGQDALITVSTGTHADSNTVIGAGAGKVISSNPSALTIIGREAMGLGTAFGGSNTALGYRAGYNQTTGASTNCTFLGATTAVSSITTAYTKSTAVGHGSTISASNQVVLGTATETVFCPNLLQVDNNFVAGASPTLITGNTTLSGAVYQFYSVSLNAGNITITLPTASADYLGCSITFRRVGTNSSNQIFASANNIIQSEAFTTTNIIMTFDKYRSTITCMLLTATPTYAWFHYIF